MLFIMFVLLLRLLAISFVFHFYKNRYPNEYNAFSKQIFDYIENNERLKPIMPYLLKVGYAFIYAYSFCQILLNKAIQITSPYVKMLRDKIMPCKISTSNTTTSNNESNKTVVAFYNDGLLVKNYEFGNFSTLLIVDIKNIQPTETFNLVTITDAKNIMTFIPDECKYELLDLRFLALYLKHDDKSHIIDLYQDNYNYYIAGNVINSAFLKYYLKNVLNVVIDNSKPFVYTLELMDHNVQMVYLDESQSIVFQKDGYIIEDGQKTEASSVAQNDDVKGNIEVVLNSVENNTKEEDYDDLPELTQYVIEEPVVRAEENSSVEERSSVEEPAINIVEKTSSKTEEKEI